MNHTKIGVCFFDDPSLGSSGWASVSGEEPRRIDDYGDLSQAHLWVTNIGFRDYKSLGLLNTAHIRDDQFFRVSTKALCQELGLTGDPGNSVKVLSEIFDNASELMTEKHGYQLSESTYRLSPSITEIFLPQALRVRPTGRNSNSMVNAFQEANQQNQNPLGITPPKGSQILPFTIPRGAYFSWLLTRNIPIGTKWREVPQSAKGRVFGYESGRVLKGTEEFISKLTEWSEDEAYFFRIGVESIDAFYRPFASFGHGAWNSRSWVSLPELLNMLRYSKVRVFEGFKTESGKLDVSNIIDDDLSFSFAYGLLLENIWNSVSIPIFGNKYCTPIASYMRAYDRVACLNLAEGFTRIGGVVGSSGSGKCMVYASSRNADDLIDFAVGHGVCPPLDIVE